MGKIDWLEATAAFLLFGVVGVELIIYRPPLDNVTREPSVSVVVAQKSTKSMVLTISIADMPNDSSLRLVAFPLSDRPVHSRSLVVFDDPDYPVANAVGTIGDAILDHLSGELYTRHYVPRVTGVKADQLRSVMMSTADASTRAVVVMTGVWPATIFSRQVDLVTPWIRAGGIVVWGAATIGYWSAGPGQLPSPVGRLSYGEAGTQLLLGKGAAIYPWVDRRVASTKTDFAQALDLTYQFTGAGLSTNAAAARGGLLLGSYSSQFSSLTFLPNGNGGYLLYGGEVFDTEAVAQDLAQLLLSGALYAAGPVASRQISSISSEHRVTISWQLPFGPPSQGVMFVAYDPNPDASLFDTRILG